MIYIQVYREAGAERGRNKRTTSERNNRKKEGEKVLKQRGDLEKRETETNREIKRKRQNKRDSQREMGWGEKLRRQVIWQ